MTVISVNNLSKQFTYYTKDVGLKNSFKNLFHREKLIKDAVNNLSFDIEEGEIVGFLGPNGAGKTTTLKMLSGILFPSSGNAHVLGFTPWERKNEFKKMFSIIMGQKNQLWWDLPALESFELNKSIYEIEDKDYNKTINELSELLDVKEQLKVQVRRLSLGERMKMELIAALLHKPKIIFMDEPTIGLDVVSQKKIRDFLKYYNKQSKTTILLTSHYMNDIEDLCKRVIIINKGCISFDGQLNKINELFNMKKIIKIQFSEMVEKQILNAYGNIVEYDGFNAIIEVEKDNINTISIKILESLPIKDFNIEDIPIEEGISLLYNSH